MNFQKVLLTAILLLGSRLIMALTVSGTVFDDGNRNGIRDASEKGLRNVPVSNGDSIVLTDSKGNYRFQTEPGNSVFPILPSGYALSSSKSMVQNAGFFYLASGGFPSDGVTVNFGLKKIPVLSSFRMAAVGDMQVDNAQEIQYTSQTLMPDLMGRGDLDFCLFLGDLVNDKPELLSAAKGMLSQIPFPSWTVLGNHDRKTKTEDRQDASYNEYFGASSYAFNYGGVHFLILNNVFSQGKAGYEGRLSEKQLTFAANDLRLVPKNSRVVMAMHIPLAYTENKEELLNLLKGYDRVLVLSAHMHTVGRFFHPTTGKPIPELSAGATCGGWWTGERDANGNPSGLMQCGSPRNYFMLDFQKDSYTLTFKGVGLDEHTQMDIWVNGQDTLDAHVDALAELPLNTVVANVFGGSDSTLVSIQVDGGQPFRMEKSRMVSPNVSRIYALSREKVYPTAYSRRAALRKQPSYHVWKALLPGNLTPGIHTIRISAKDHFGFEAEGARTFSTEVK